MAGPGPGRLRTDRGVAGLPGPDRSLPAHLARQARARQPRDGLYAGGRPVLPVDARPARGRLHPGRRHRPRFLHCGELRHLPDDPDDLHAGVVGLRPTTTTGACRPRPAPGTGGCAPSTQQPVGTRRQRPVLRGRLRSPGTRRPPRPATSAAVTGQRLVLDGNGSTPCTASLSQPGRGLRGRHLDADARLGPGAGRDVVHRLPGARPQLHQHGRRATATSVTRRTWVRTINTRFVAHRRAARHPGRRGVLLVHPGLRQHRLRADAGRGVQRLPEEVAGDRPGLARERRGRGRPGHVRLDRLPRHEPGDDRPGHGGAPDPGGPQLPDPGLAEPVVRGDDGTDKVYEQVVDQTTFTEFENAYPEGMLYWRVQAIDGSGNGLTWSPSRAASPSPRPRRSSTAPTDGAGGQRGPALPLAAAAVRASTTTSRSYRNATPRPRPATWPCRVTNIRQAAYTAREPLQALGQDFVWRVRRTDHDGHAGCVEPVAPLPGRGECRAGCCRRASTVSRPARCSRGGPRRRRRRTGGSCVEARRRAVRARRRRRATPRCGR